MSALNFLNFYVQFRKYSPTQNGRVLKLKLCRVYKKPHNLRGIFSLPIEVYIYEFTVNARIKHDKWKFKDLTCVNFYSLGGP